MTKGEVIINEVTALPATGTNGIWYFFEGNYYYWNKNVYTSVGGDRPPKPPVNP